MKISHLRTLDGDRWSCNQCGLCCRFHALGPVAPEVIAQLGEAGIESLWAPAAERPWVERRREGLFLSRVDGACIFLTEQRRCAIHERLGPTFKPGFCQQFPFQVVAEGPESVAVSLRADCGGVGAPGGAPIPPQALAALSVTRRVSRAPAAIEILPGIEAPLEVWRGLEIELLAALESEGPLPPDAAARRIRAQLYDWAERPCPASDPGRASQAMGAVLAGLDMILGRLVLPVPSDPSTEPAEARFFRERQEDVQRARAPGEPPPLEPDGAACLDLVLRSRLLGKRLVGGLPQAVGAHLVDAWIARRSAASGAGSDLRAVLPLWSRFALHGAARMVLERARPALTDLFLYT